MVCYKCWTKVHIILELVMFNPCFLCLLPTYGGNVISHQETNKATTMAATLNTRLDALMFSSLVPDIWISVTDDNEAEVMLNVPDMTIFSACIFHTATTSPSTICAR